VKLLLDQNLSRRLVPFLQEIFPGTSQVALVGMERASDAQIWDYAKIHGFVIVSNDADFEDLSSLRGAPPHVVRLRAGNLSKPAMLALLTASASVIQQAVETDCRAYIEILKRSE
jgi:predicted nuclease of predicted toxin-antitoxin system